MHVLKGYKYTVNNARKHIEKIMNSYLSVEEGFVLSSLRRSVERISTFFGGDGAFIAEFVDNADAVGSTRVRVEFTAGCVKIFNDGAPFSGDDVESLCRVGFSCRSSCKEKPFSGTGFKSVFLVSDHIELYSGDYRFMFSRTHWQDREDIPWQVIPLWIESAEQLIPEGFNTLFRIEIKEPAIMERLRRAISSSYIQAKNLLFRENIDRVEIKDYISDTRRYIQKERIKKTPEYAIYRLKEFVNGTERPYEDWVVFTHLVDVPEEVLNGCHPLERSSLRQKRKVIMAFRLHKDGDLMITGLGWPVQFSSSLAMVETKTQFNFLVRADFMSRPLQGNSVEDNPWNRWLCREIYRMITEKCIPVFLKDSRWSKSFLEVLYPAEKAPDRLFEEGINAPLKKYLETSEVLTTVDGSVVNVKSALLIMSSKIKELLGEEELKTLYPDRKVLHPALRIPYDIRKLIKEGPDYSDTYGANKELLKLLELKARSRDIEFFRRFYHHLSEFAEILRNSYLKYSNIVLTEDWELVDPGFAYIRRGSINVPDRLKNTVKIVHPELAKDTLIQNTLKLLGVEELSKEYIDAMLQLKDRFRI